MTAPYLVCERLIPPGASLAFCRICGAEIIVRSSQQDTLRDTPAMLAICTVCGEIRAKGDTA